MAHRQKSTLVKKYIVFILFSSLQSRANCADGVFVTVTVTSVLLHLQQTPLCAQQSTLSTTVNNVPFIPQGGTKKQRNDILFIRIQRKILYYLLI